MAKYNKNFAKSEDGTVLEFAPGEFDFCGVRYNAVNDERIYAQMGYLKYRKTEKPPEKEDSFFVPYYETNEEEIVERWREIKKEESILENDILSAIEEGVNEIDF